MQHAKFLKLIARKKISWKKGLKKPFRIVGCKQTFNLINHDSISIILYLSGSFTALSKLSFIKLLVGK